MCLPAEVDASSLGDFYSGLTENLTLIAQVCAKTLPFDFIIPALASEVHTALDPTGLNCMTWKDNVISNDCLWLHAY